VPRRDLEAGSGLPRLAARPARGQAIRRGDPAPPGSERRRGPVRAAQPPPLRRAGGQFVRLAERLRPGIARLQWSSKGPKPLDLRCSRRDTADAAETRPGSDMAIRAQETAAPDGGRYEADHVRPSAVAQSGRPAAAQTMSTGAKPAPKPTIWSAAE